MSPADVMFRGLATAWSRDAKKYGNEPAEQISLMGNQHGFM
jgi:hypothetical protein